jgi:hypothetical protein
MLFGIRKGDNMNGVFYSRKEKILFWIVGYTDSSSFVEDIVEMLQTWSVKFRAMIPYAVEISQVRTFFIESSSCFKNMRVFYIYNASSRQLPKDTLKLKNHTMNEWIRK